MSFTEPLFYHSDDEGEKERWRTIDAIGERINAYPGLESDPDYMMPVPSSTKVGAWLLRGEGDLDVVDKPARDLTLGDYEELRDFMLELIIIRQEEITMLEEEINRRDAD